MRKKILAIDDDEDILEALQLTLESGGYEAAVVTKAEDTLTMVDLFKPDLILLDVLLSGNDGRIICKQLKTEESTKHIPVIMLSAHSDATNTVTEYGADQFIPKPFNVSALLSTIEKYLPA